MIVICPMDVAVQAARARVYRPGRHCRPATAKFAQFAVRELLPLLDHSLTHADA